MGQVIGTPVLHPRLRRFSLLPKEAIDNMWKTYNLLGEAWGLNIHDVRGIMKGSEYLVNALGVHDEDVNALFVALDTDMNGLVDALEMIVAIGLISGLDAIEKAYFVFSVYDFESRGSLSNDELSLMLRSNAKALAKVFPDASILKAIDDGDIEKHTSLIYAECKKVMATDRIASVEFKDYCMSHPVIVNWLELASLSYLVDKNVNSCCDEPAASIYGMFDPDLNASSVALTNLPPIKMVKEDEEEKSLLGSVSNDGGEDGAGAGGNIDGGEENSFDAGPKDTESLEGPVASLSTQTDSQTKIDEEERKTDFTLPWFQLADELKEQEKEPVAENAEVSDGKDDKNAKVAKDAKNDQSLAASESDLSVYNSMHVRFDPPEDILEPLWIHGFNCGQGIFYEPPPPSTLNLESNGTSGEEGEAGAANLSREFKGYSCGYTSENCIVYSASRYLILLQRSEDEKGKVRWSQLSKLDHQFPISSIEFSADHDYCITTEAAPVHLDMNSLLPPVDGRLEHDQLFSSKQFIHVWRMSDHRLNLVNSFPFPTKIKILMTSMSSDNQRMLVITLEDHDNTFALVYGSFTRTLISKVYLRTGFNCINDVTFCTSSAIFAVSGNTGLDFYVDEGLSTMGPGGFLQYALREAKYQVVGQPAMGKPVLCLTRFEGADELACGTDDGHVLFWHFRSCTQCLRVHKAAIVRITFDSASNSVVTCGVDGKIVILKLQAQDLKNPRAQYVRLLEISGTIMATRHSIPKKQMQCVHTSLDGSRLVLAVRAGEILELCLNGPEKVEETISNVEVVSKAIKLGDDYNNSPVISSHLNKTRLHDVCGTHVDSKAKGFITCGADCSVRIWSAEDGQHRCTRSVNIDAGCLKVCCTASFVAVGLDGSVNPVRGGCVQIYSLPDLHYISELKESYQSVILDMKFISTVPVIKDDDPEEFLLVSTDKGFFMYRIDEEGESHEKDWPLVATFQLLFNAIHFDVSVSGSFIRAMGSGQDFAVASIEPGASCGMVVNAPELLNSMKFLTNSVIYQWDQKGVFNHFRDIGKEATKIPTCDRSGHLLLTGHDDGSIVLTRLPAPTYMPAFDPITNLQNPLDPKRPPLTRICPHNSAVKALTFIDDMQKMVSVGAIDGLVIVWRVLYDYEKQEVDYVPPPVMDAPKVRSGDDDDEEEDDEDDEDKPKPPPKPVDSDDDDDLKDGNKMLEHLTFRKSLPDRTALNAFSKNVDIADADKLKDNADVVSEKVQKLKFCLVDGPVQLLKVKGKGKKKPQKKLKGVKSKEDEVVVDKHDDLPPGELYTSWVHGYSARKTKNSVRLNSRESLVYPAGSNIIIYDKVEHAQMVVPAHRDNVTCMDVHQASDTGASCHQGSGLIRISVWSAVTGVIYRHINCGFVIGASALQISHCGRYVMISCMDLLHSVLMFDINSGVLLSRVSAGPAKVLVMAFSQGCPDGINDAGKTWRVFIGGSKHFQILEARQSCNRRFFRKTGLFTLEKKVDVNCVASVPLKHPNSFLKPEESANKKLSKKEQLQKELEELQKVDNEFVAGLSNGMLAFVARGERNFSTFVPIQEGEDAAVTALVVVKIRDATPELPNPLFKIIAGCTKGVILVLNEEGQLLLEHNPYNIQPDGSVPTFNLNPFGMIRQGYRSLAVDKDRIRLFFGTSAGEISEIEIESGYDLNQGQGPLVANHFRGQLNALAVHPLKQEVMTAGDDKVVRIWDLEQNIMTNQLVLPEKATCCCYAPNGIVVCVGMAKPSRTVIEGDDEPTAGVALILYMNNVLQLVNVTKDATASITCLVFNPDCSKLYVGSADTMIYVYDGNNNFALSTAISGHERPVANFDMSSDGNVLVSYGTTGEIVFWDATINSPLVDEARAEFLANPTYMERQGAGGRDAIGIFRTDGDFQEISATCQSKDGTLMVTGDVFGTLRMYAYPNRTVSSPHRIYRLHSAGGVAKVSFSKDDQYLVAIGKHDKTVSVWRVELPSAPTPEMKEAAMALAVAVVPTTAVIIPKMREDALMKFDQSFQLKGVWFLPQAFIPPPPAPGEEDNDGGGLKISASGGRPKAGSKDNTPHNSEFVPEGVEDAENELACNYSVEARILNIAGVAGHRYLKPTDSNLFKGKRQKRPKTASSDNFGMDGGEFGEDGGGGNEDNDGRDEREEGGDNQDNDAAAAAADGDDDGEEETNKKKKKKKGKKGKKNEKEEIQVEVIKPFPYSSALFALPAVKFCGSKDILTCSGKIPSIIRRSNGINNMFTLASGVVAPDSLLFDDIGAVAVSACARFVAIGSIAAWDASVLDRATYPGTVNIFQAYSYEVICSIPDLFVGGVVGAAFSYTVNASYLAILCGDIAHTVYVFVSLSGHWDDCELLLTCVTSLSELSLVAFVSSASSLPPASGRSARASSRRSTRPATGNSGYASSRPSTGKTDDVNENDGNGAGDGVLKPIKLERNTIAVAGVGGLFFLDIIGNNVVKTEALAAPLQRRAFGITSLVAVPYAGQVIVGNGSGEIWAWFHPNSKLPPQQVGGPGVLAHDGPVSALHSYYWNPLDDKEREASLVPASDVDAEVCGISPSKLANSSRKIVPRLKSLTSARQGFVSGSKDKLCIWDSQTLTLTRSILIPELMENGHFATCMDARFKITDDKDFFVTGISSDVKFKRLVVALSSSQIVEVAVDSLANHQVLYCDTRVVKYFDVHPVARDIVITVTTDNMINAFSMGNKKVVGQMQIPHRVTGIFFLTPNILLVGMGDCDADGKGGAVLSVHLILQTANGYILNPCDRNSSPFVLTFTIVDRLHNVGRGGASTFKANPDRTKLSIASEDGFVYLAQINDSVYDAPHDKVPAAVKGKKPHLSILGGMKTYASNVPVATSDWSCDGCYVRAFGICETGNRYVTVDYFDVKPPEPKNDEERAAAAAAAATAAKVTPTSNTMLGRKILEPVELEGIRDNVKWSTLSSPAVPDLRGLYLPEMREKGTGFELISHVVSQDMKIVAASYSDGIIRVFRMPLFDKTSKPIFVFNAHLRGPVWMTLWSDLDEVRCLKKVTEEEQQAGSLGDHLGGIPTSYNGSNDSNSNNNNNNNNNNVNTSKKPQNEVDNSFDDNGSIGSMRSMGSKVHVDATLDVESANNKDVPNPRQSGEEQPIVETYKLLTHGVVDFTFMTWEIHISHSGEEEQ